MRAADAARFVPLLSAQSLGGRWLPEIPEDHYLFAGEIPWSPSFAPNDWNVMEFRSAPADADTEAADTDADAGDADDALPQPDPEPVEETAAAAEARAQLAETVRRVLLAEDISESAGEVPADIDALRNAIRLASATIRPRSEWVERRPDPNRTFDVMLPVRRYAWESYHSAANAAHGAHVPAKELAQSLGLWLALPTWDFHAPDGRRGTRYVASGVFGNGEHLLYMHRDLLERALADLGLVLVWAVWGERRLMDVEHARAARAGGPRPYAVHQRVSVFE